MKCAMKSQGSSVYSDGIRRIAIAFVAIVAFFAVGNASEPTGDEVLRPVAASYTFQVGGAHITDTYLSPLKYSGTSLKLGYERLQAMKFDPERWVMQMLGGVTVYRTHNPAGNATMWYWGVDYSWAMMRRWMMSDGLYVGAGGAAALDLGCVYAPRNGNNPAAAKASVLAGITGYAAWNLKIASLPVTLRYQPTLPVVGAFFSPEYGELYYEIYLGNRSGLAHCAWIGNYFSFKNLLTVDLHFGATALRIGYAGDILSTRINNLTTNLYSHRVVIGVSGEWLSIDRRKASLLGKARIISAIY